MLSWSVRFILIVPLFVTLINIATLVGVHIIRLIRWAGFIIHVVGNLSVSWIACLFHPVTPIPINILV